MKTIPFIILFFFLLLSTSCNKEDSKPTEIKTVQLTQKQKELVGKSNSFGFTFFKTALGRNTSNKNMMISPLSVSMALGMTRNGASGTTLSAMTSTLGFDGMSDTEINDSYKYIIETFTKLDSKVNLSIANSIWYRNTFSVLDAFKNTNKEYFNATVTPLDFMNPESVNTINSWVSEKTNNLIPKIVDKISSDNVMFLINAVYFKGQWKYQFDKNNSGPKPFYLSNGTAIQAQSMVQHATLPYFENTMLQAVEMPYNQGNYTMTLVIPKGSISLKDVANSLNTSPDWLFVDKDIQVQLPKFKFEYSEEAMLDILTQMGMGVAFIPGQADFTRINPQGDLFISAVKHKTFIETNEEGTEAAAVTSVVVSVTSFPGGPTQFIVDKPFIFFIREKSTGTILFIGTVQNPV